MLKKISWILLISVFMISISSGTAFADTESDSVYTVFSNDFESETENLRISTSEDNNLLRFTDDGDVSSEPYQVTVLKDEINNNKYLVLRRNSDTSPERPSVTKRIFPTDNCKVDISFKLQTNSQYFELQCYTLKNGVRQLVRPIILNNESNITQNDYIDVAVSIDFSAKTINSYIKDGITFDTVRFLDTMDYTDGFYIRFTAMPSAGEAVYVDDVLFTSNDIYVAERKLLDVNTLTFNDEDNVSKIIKETHPRIFVNDFDIIKDKIDNDTLSQNWYNRIISRADRYVTENRVIEYTADGSRTQASAREIRYKLYILSFAYAVSENDDYKNLVLSEIRNVAGYPDWYGYLQSAEISAGFAVAYDWLYNCLSADEKTEIKNIMLDKGLYYAALAYERKAYDSFITARNNQNIACNSLYMLTAIAFDGDIGTLSGYILQKGASSLPTGLAIFSPDGAAPDGYGYWDYSMISLYTLMAALDSSIEDGALLPEDYDFSGYPGISSALYYPIYMRSDSGAFNYGDADVGDAGSFDFSFAYWAADKFSETPYASYQYNNVDKVGNGGTVWCLIHKLCYFNDTHKTSDISLPLDKAYISDDWINLASMRSSWDRGQIFAAVQGGRNDFSHMYQSLGTFVIDSFGERFATMRGRGNYSWPGYFDTENQRWDYYIARTEGQNCIVINPDKYSGQSLVSTAKITDCSSLEDEAYAVVDLTDTYSDDVSYYKRGIKLFDNRSKILIQDDIRAKDVIENGYWFMHTDCDIEILDGGNSVMLTSQSGKRLYGKIVSGFSGAAFSKMKAEALGTSPKPEAESDADYGYKLAIDLTGARSFSLSVIFVPLDTEDDIPLIQYEHIALDMWDGVSEEIYRGYSYIGTEKMSELEIFSDNFNKEASTEFDKRGYARELNYNYTYASFGNPDHTTEYGSINYAFDAQRDYLKFDCKSYQNLKYILGRKYSPQPNENGQYGSYAIEFDILPQSADTINCYLRSDSFSQTSLITINGTSAQGYSYSPDQWHNVLILLDIDNKTSYCYVDGILAKKISTFNCKDNMSDPGYLDMNEFRISAVMADNSYFGIDNFLIRKCGGFTLLYDTCTQNSTTVIKAQKSVINESTADLPVAIYLAGYDENTMTEIAIENTVLKPHQGMNFDKTVSADNAALFVWSGNDLMTPLCQRQFYKVKQ